MIEREHSGVVDALNAGPGGRRAASVVVQLDADATLETPGWLERMVAFLDSDDAGGRGDRPRGLRLGRAARVRRSR